MMAMYWSFLDDDVPATRQKHFHHASWSMFGRDGHVSFNMALRADEFVAAHTNCRWGV